MVMFCCRQNRVPGIGVIKLHSKVCQLNNSRLEFHKSATILQHADKVVSGRFWLWGMVT